MAAMLPLPPCSWAILDACADAAGAGTPRAATATSATGILIQKIARRVHSIRYPPDWLMARVRARVSHGRDERLEARSWHL
jgi:hypothetical protein